MSKSIVNNEIFPYTIVNDDTDESLIKETDVFAIQENKCFIASYKADTLRLLIPDEQISVVHELIQSGKLQFDYVVIRSGLFVNTDELSLSGDKPVQDVDCIELLFEDHSSAPFSIHIEKAACENELSKRSRGPLKFAAYTKYGKLLDSSALFENVLTLPDLRPWDNGFFS
ncbi:hypothetical protein EIJ81_01040 (plasmid) [Aliivibrio salmonicida]|uniref:hypothetical protein n=1 Tax=Aliivibrio salmonicida TaxID=40269 RepID=UPI000F70A0A2|nr:hypothetical protein [Aliivibrio salmonicida]AZL83485.1 hypothetical protein EIJ81_01040 [Aliivibrio salmonicida]